MNSIRSNYRNFKVYTIGLQRLEDFSFCSKDQIIYLQFLFMYFQITSFLLTLKHIPVFLNQPTSPLKNLVSYLPRLVL